jgi:hypothetical protein
MGVQLLKYVPTVYRDLALMQDLEENKIRPKRQPLTAWSPRACVLGQEILKQMWR